MLRKLWINGIKWFDWIWLNEDEIKELLAKYNVHELDVEACLEGNQKSRIDTYDDYSFIVFHFPKYNPNSKIYDLNEFNIFLGKEFLLVLRDYKTSHIDYIMSHYKTAKKVDDPEEKIKFTSWYILYEIVQSMLEKMFKTIKNITLDVKQLEKEVFENPNSSLVKDIMIKKEI